MKSSATLSAAPGTSLASELVLMPCDLILAVTTPAVAAAQQRRPRFQVMSPATDPVGSDFIKSFARPGGNITGVANLYGDMVGKSIEFLHMIVPGAKKIAVLMSSNPTHPYLYDVARAGAESLGLSSVPALAPVPDDLDGAFQKIAKESCDALLVLADPVRPMATASPMRRAGMTAMPARPGNIVLAGTP
jgi:putative tryptophan/tyrosine transport system substrate-binding protein